MERLRCGSLRDIDTSSGGLPKKKGSRTPDSSKRSRKSFRRNGGVQSLTPPRRISRKRSDTSRDPLNIVGNELFVRDHTLSTLEGSEHSINSRRGGNRKPEDEENSEIKSLLNDAIIDDEEQYNMKLVQQKLQEERLYNLSKIPAGLPISELDNPIDQQLGGIEENILHSYSSSSININSSTSSISTVQSSSNINKGQEQANKILHKIHGKRRISNTHYQQRNIYPNCPNCPNKLIYLYLHHSTTTCPTVPKLTTSHLHLGNVHNSKSTKYKLNNILPPKCIDCNIYYIYDYISSVYKDIMIDNMMRWIDNIDNDDSSNDDCGKRGDDNGTYVNEFGVVVDGNKYPRCSKLVVINSTPKGQDANNNSMDDDVVVEEGKKRGFHETMQITTSFQRPRSNLTPRPQHERQNSRVSFKFDNEDCPVYPRGDNGEEGEEMETMVVSPRPLFSPRNETGGTIFSGLSSLTEQPQHREGEGGGDNMEVKKSLSDEDPFTDISCQGSHDENDMSDDEKNEDVDDDVDEDDSCGSISQWLPNSVDEEKDNVGEESDEVDICQDNKEDEDNIQRIALEDEKIPLTPPPPPQAENDSPENDERDDEETVAVEQTQNQVKSESVTSPPPDTSSIKSSESNSNNIKLIHTESEERMILEKYSLKKEIATRQIAKDLIQGHGLTTLECQRCKMPMTKMKDNEGKFVECTTCQAVKRNAKRIARRKRSKLSIRSGAASVDEDDEPHQVLSPGSILSQEVTKIPPPINNEFVDKKNDTNLFHFHPDEKGEKVNIPVNALSVLEQGPCVQENENTTLVSLNRKEIQDLTALEEGLRISDEIDPIEMLSCTFGNSGDGSSSSAASSNNSIGLNNNVKDREGDDYWLRHAIMSNNVKQMMIQPSSLNHICVHTPSTTRKEPRGSETTDDEIEYSLSFYQENVKQQTEEYSRQQSNVVSTSAIAALPSVDELSQSMMSNQYPIPEASRYQLYQETLALENQAADGTTTLPVSEKEQWLKALAIPLDGSKDKLNLSHHSHSTSLHHPESISEVSEYSKQVLGSSSSDESSTRCPRTLPPSEMTYQPYYFPVVEEREGVGAAQLGHAYTGSISEVSGCNEGPLVPNEKNQQQKNDVTTVDILIGLSSDESLTNCPRDLPPSDMIWDSQPTPSATVYPVQSIARGHHQQAIKPTDDNLRLVAAKTSQEKVAQGTTLLTPFDLQNVEDDHNHKVDTKLNSEVDTEDNSVVSGEKGEGSALLQASLSPSSLNERIARLAESLREVASQLPKEGNVQSESKQTSLSDDTKLEEEDIMHNDMLSVLEEEEEDPSCQVPHIHQRTFSPIQQPVNEYQIEEEIVDQHTSRHRSPLHRLQSAPLAISPYTFQPIPLRSNSVGNNGHGISISPINVCRDEKQFDLFSSDNDDEGEEEVIVHPSPKKIQRCDHIKTPQECIPTSPPQEDRSDPPGRQVEASGHEKRDPPENDSTTNDDSPNSKSISSTNLTQVSEKNQSARDPPPSTTPNSRGRRRKRLIAACNDDDATEEKLVEEMKVAASRPDFIHRNKPITNSDRETLVLEVDDDAYSVIDAPIQSTKSSGSMNELFQQIDDLEIDFQRTIASMPGSEGMSYASLKSYSNDNHSLVEITLNNGIMDSFDSENHLAEEEDSLVSEVVERMHKIKDCLARVESVDEEDDCRSDVDTVSQCESETMTVLMNRLEAHVGELRDL